MTGRTEASEQHAHADRIYATGWKELAMPWIGHNAQIDFGDPYRPMRVCSCGWTQLLSSLPDGSDDARWHEHLAGRKAAYQHESPAQDGFHIDDSDGITVTAVCRCGWQGQPVPRTEGAQLDWAYRVRDQHVEEAIQFESVNGPWRPFETTPAPARVKKTPMWAVLAGSVVALAAVLAWLFGSGVLN